MPIFLLFILLFLFLTSSFSEELTNFSMNDSVFKLEEIQINAYKTNQSISHNSSYNEQMILSGKKNELLQINQINANKITNVSRQIFAKIPGIYVWENEGSGTQINVSARGLSPNRSWEFNVRQNGYDVTPDIFGYPEAYYNPPLEAVKSIQVIRGAASLQFGPQFGGLLNYILYKGAEHKKYEVVSQNSIGNNGLFNTFNSIGGTVKNLNYYAFYNYKRGNGWRENNSFNVHNAHVNLNYTIKNKISIGGEYSFLSYVIQQPGGLTDSMFRIDTKQSIRERNWFNVNWHIAALNLEYRINSNATLTWKNNTVIGERNSIGFLKGITIKDTINASTLNYNNRQIDKDKYYSFNSEARLFYKYKFLNLEQVLNTGIRVSHSRTLRQQLGKGDTGTEFNLNLQQDSFPRALHFTTTNVALFAEQLFQFTKNFSVTPGIRYEFVRNSIQGRIDNTFKGPVNINRNQKEYHVVLAGLGLQYSIFNTTNLYANVAQAFRPVLYSDLTPSSTTDIIDENLKASSGINVDFGYRGSYKDFLAFDVSGYYLLYKNRIGNLLKYTDNDLTKSSFILKTNLGNTRSIGLECFIEADVVKPFTQKRKYGTLSLFTSIAITDARYQNYSIYKSSGTAPNIVINEVSLKNKRVEYAPLHNHKFGATYKVKDFSTSIQVSVTSSVYTDAENTEKSNATATVGKIAGYTLLDWSFTYNFLKYFNLKGGVNNLTNKNYATRRAGGFPGPGLMPADGITWFISFGIKI